MKRLVTTAPVDIALRSLESDDVRKVQASFDQLRNWNGDASVGTHSYRLEAVPDVYVLRVGKDIRIFFKIDGNTITILDVAKKSAIIASGKSPGAG
jgi:hypothetical protein